MAHNRTGESEISDAVLKILSEMPNGEATIQQLVSKIPKVLKLTDGDLAQSETRQNEAVWEQIVRNIVSHKKAGGNIINEGLANSPSRGKLRITEAGRTYILHKIG
jgi:Mrr N-terminal domain